MAINLKPLGDRVLVEPAESTLWRQFIGAPVAGALLQEAIDVLKHLDPKPGAMWDATPPMPAGKSFQRK